VSRFDKIESELFGLRKHRVISVVVPVLLASALIAVATKISQIPLSPWLAALATLIIGLFALHWAWQEIFPTYRLWCERSAAILLEIENLRRRVDAIFERYPERQKGEQFKQAYKLTGKTVQELEEALSVGMYREKREVFVIAFMRKGVVARVTASIGSPFQCSPADDPTQWAAHVERLLCDEIRHYHNHPEHNGTTEPSGQDYRSFQSMKLVLHQHGNKLRSFVICWNQIREWRVFEYNHDGRHWLLAEFDAAAS
jgi:ABC-type nickel/cobalt efflux system permease component RcnA